MKLYLLNGFLGSGKTTAIAAACTLLREKDIPVAVITNDQGEQQVDNAYLQKIAVQSVAVANGCFCCRYNELEEKIQLLSAYDPQIIFAESVGSCADIVATIVKPLSTKHDSVKVIVSVFADAYLLHSIMKGTSCFIEESVQYIFRKQLEEADIIVLNKTDLLGTKETEFVKKMLSKDYPAKKIIEQNSFNANDVLNWLQTLDDFHVPQQRKSLELDYDTYSAGEAMLAWFDGTISIHAARSMAVEFGRVLAASIYLKIVANDLTIGHLKFLLQHDSWYEKISYTTSHHNVQQVTEPHLCKHLDVIINARVQSKPQILQQIINESIEELMTQTGCRIVIHKTECFAPAYPTPVHRIAE